MRRYRLCGVLVRCPAYDILILFGTRNNFTFSGAPALFVKGCVVLQWPLCLWTQVATNDSYLLYWEPTWNNLYRPEFLLWRTALWKCLVLDTFQHVPSGARATFHLLSSAVGVQVLEEAWVALEQPVSRCSQVVVVPELPYLEPG